MAGPDILGFTADEIGLHSDPSGPTMALYLAWVSIFTIMSLGPWLSMAFLCFIRKQVKEFRTGISQKMIQNEEVYTIPGSFIILSTTLLKAQIDFALHILFAP